MPFVPPVILAIIGSVILAGAFNPSEQKSTKKKKEIVVDRQKASLNKKLETIAWGLFLIMLGGFAFIPQESVPEGAWSICVGLIMLGLNLIRYLNGIKMSAFTTVLGILALLSGVLQIFGLHDIEGPTLLIILGCYLLVKPLIEKQGLFGKAEEK